MLEIGLLTIAGVGIEIGIGGGAIVLVKWPGTGKADGTGMLALAIAAGITDGICGLDTLTNTDTGAALDEVTLGVGIVNVGGILAICEGILFCTGIVVNGGTAGLVVLDWFVVLIIITLSCVVVVFLVELVAVVA